MRRLQCKAGYSAVGCGVLVILVVLAFQASALAQNPAVSSAEGGPALDCERSGTTQSVTDAAVMLSPSRGWQMVGREIDVTITSSNLPADAKPVVCFGWKLKHKDGERKFVQVDTVRIVQQSPESKQPPKPPSLKLAVPVPYIGSVGDQAATTVGAGQPNKPDKNVVEYSAYDRYAPIAEVRILIPGRDATVIDVITSVAVVNEQDYCNVPIGRGVRIDSGTTAPSASKNWQPVGGEIEFTAKSAKPFPSDGQINVCFRWKVTDGEHSVFNDSGPIRILDFQPNSVPSAIKLAVEVPRIIDDHPPGTVWLRSKDDRIGSFAVPWLVPEADVRTLVFDKDLNPVFDNAGRAGVTSRGLAFIDISRLCKPVAIPNHAMDVRGHGCVGLRDCARRRFDRDHVGYFDPARNLWRHRGPRQGEDAPVSRTRRRASGAGGTCATSRTGSRGHSAGGRTGCEWAYPTTSLVGPRHG